MRSQSHVKINTLMGRNDLRANEYAIAFNTFEWKIQNTDNNISVRVHIIIIKKIGYYIVP